MLPTLVTTLSLICVSQTFSSIIKKFSTFTYPFDPILSFPPMVMGKQNNQNFQDHQHQTWDIMKNESYKHDHEHEHEQHPCSSLEEASTISNMSSSSSSTCCSSSSFDTTDDACSANSSRSSLYDMSDLMSQLPIKRGLSKFYHGKSDSFSSLARVTSIEDIPKKDNKLQKKMKKNYTLPKPLISKKHSRKKRFNINIKKQLNE